MLQGDGKERYMPAEYELCRSNLETLVASEIAKPSHRNEATTRLQLIDCLFFDCLGWSKEDVVLEESDGREYADYTFYLGFARRRVLIVEAKKEGDYFEVPVGNGNASSNGCCHCHCYNCQ